MINAVDSELALIGAAMLEREAMDEACERLRPEHFADPLFARLWDYIRRTSRALDPIMVANAFAADADIIEFGGVAWLADVADKAVLYTVDAHIEAVLDASVRRELQNVSKEIADRAPNEPGKGEVLLADLERAAADIARSGAQKVQAVAAGLGAAEMLEIAYQGGFQGAPVGIGCLDHVTGGIKQDDVWFIGGRTSMGKSVAGLCLARGIAEQGRGVLAFSLEMPLREVQARLIADIAYDRRIPENGHEGGNVRYGDILKGRGTPQQQAWAKSAARKLASLPINVNDQGGLSIEDIRSQAQRQFRAWDRAGVPRGAVLIDHIGLVKPAKGRSSDNKAAETADIVNELKGLAKQLRAPIIALCQVNRNTENRQDKRPTLADLNWSGAIEQIADFIVLLYRDAYYLERSTNTDDEMEAARKKYDIELLIQKNRSGPICSPKAFIDIACNAIRDLDAEPSRAFG